MTLRTRDAYREIELYDPKRTPCAIDLSDNTNLFGVAPAMRALLRDMPDNLITRYPSVFADRLKHALAQRHGVNPENITTGCGSDDVIDSTMRAFCEPGDRVCYAMPTFGVVPTFARMNAAAPIQLEYNADFTLDVNQLADAGAAVTYVCTPNNPTGTTISPQTIAALDEQLTGLLLLDEAYADFGDVDFAGFAAASARTVSLRTMSKASGLAGLRVGYAIGSADVILEIEKSRGPYKVNAVAEAAATSIVSQDASWVADVVAQTKANRRRLAEILTDMGLKHWPSAANFILIKLPEPLSSETANRELRTRGVAVRPFSGVLHAGDCIRVTIGPWEMMDAFLTIFKNVLAMRLRS